MAVNLIQQTSFDIAGVVNGALTAVYDVKRAEQARKTAEFQRAIADGTMSYDAQIRYIESQIKEETESTLADPEFMARLKTTLGDTKKLKRFAGIRERYKNALDGYVSGKGNMDNVIEILQDAIAGENDDKIKNELRNQLTSALSERTQLERTAVQNRILVAERDKSVDLVDKSIGEIKELKSDALLAGDDATASMWDATLASLRSTKASIQIDTAITDINYRINRENLSSAQKLDLLSQQFASASGDAPVVYNGVRYNSMQDFWGQKRSEYIADSYLTELKTEIEAETNRIAQSSPFGQVPIERIEAISSFYNDLVKRPEFQPFAQELEQERLNTVYTLAEELQSSIETEIIGRINRGEDVTTAENRLFRTMTTLENRLGVKLGRETTSSELAANRTIESEVTRTDPLSDRRGSFPTPGQKPAAPVASVDLDGDDDEIEYNALLAKPITSQTRDERSRFLELSRSRANLSQEDSQPSRQAAPVAPKPAVAPVQNAPSNTYVVKQGDTLSAIAARTGTSVERLVELNSIQDKNRIGVNQTIKLK